MVCIERTFSPASLEIFRYHLSNKLVDLKFILIIKNSLNLTKIYKLATELEPLSGEYLSPP